MATTHEVHHYHRLPNGDSVLIVGVNNPRPGMPINFQFAPTLHTADGTTWSGDSTPFRSAAYEAARAVSYGEPPRSKMKAFVEMLDTAQSCTHVGAGR